MLILAIKTINSIARVKKPPAAKSAGSRIAIGEQEGGVTLAAGLCFAVKRAAKPIGAALVAAALLTSCSAHSNAFAPVENALNNGDPERAESELSAKTPDDADLLMYELNKGLILQIGGKYKESLQSFENAKTLVNEYDAASVSEQLTATLTNDTMIAYYGEDYERLYLHFYAAASYLMLGDLTGARVEMAQANELIKGFKGKYQDDGAARYLSALIYDALGETSSAMVSYRQAIRAYRDQAGMNGAPSALMIDALRYAKRYGGAGEAAKYEKQFGGEIAKKAAEAGGKNTGEVVAIVSSGFAPIKLSHKQLYPAPAGALVSWVEIALPYHQARSRGDFTAQIDGAASSAEMVSNVSALFTQAFDEKQTEVIARAITRAVAKKAAEYAARQASGGKNTSAGSLAAVAMFLVNAATEVADTRSWLALPDRIYFVRARLPAGVHKLRVNNKEYEINIEEGKRTFFVTRVF